MTAVLENSDLMLISRNDIDYQITGQSIKANLFPSNGLAPLVPPFAAQANTPLTLSSPNKIQYSLDQETWTSSISVALNEIVYVRWDTGINSAAQGTAYEGSITVGYTVNGTSHAVDVKIDSVNRVPDAFSFQGQTGTTPGDEVTSNSVFPQTYNTPAFIWNSSNATLVEIQIANSGTWIVCPTSPSASQSSNIRVGPRQELQVRHKTPLEAGTTTNTSISVGYGTGAGENQTSTFITTTDNALVDQPAITSPVDGATEIPIGDTTPIICTPFAGDGDSSTYLNTDWQLATTPDYSVIAQESLNDSTNVSTWYPTLEYGMNCYPRVRYRATDGTVSAWSPAVSFQVTLYKPPFVNGTWTSSMYPYTSDTNYPGGQGQFTTFAVPAEIGKVRCTLMGSGYNLNNSENFPQNYIGYGGKLIVEFSVTPGEILRIYNCGSNHGVFINGAQTQANCLAVVGGAGGTGTKGDGRITGAGGNGGPSGGSATGCSNNNGNAYGGTGATTSSPGSGGGSTYGSQNGGPGEDGSAFRGGAASSSGPNPDNGGGASGGYGGGGWYGGGGGGQIGYYGCGGGGGGGSNKANAGDQLIPRNQTVLLNDTGTNEQGYLYGNITAYGNLVIEY